MKKLLVCALFALSSLAWSGPCKPGNFAALGSDGDIWCCKAVGDGSAYSCTNGSVCVLAY